MSDKVEERFDGSWKPDPDPLPAVGGEEGGRGGVTFACICCECCTKSAETWQKYGRNVAIMCQTCGRNMAYSWYGFGRNSAIKLAEMWQKCGRMVAEIRLELSRSIAGRKLENDWQNVGKKSAESPHHHFIALAAIESSVTGSLSLKPESTSLY